MFLITSAVLRRAVLISVLTLIPAACVVMKLKTNRLSGDGPSYLDIAQSIASGKGIQEPHGMWPGHPTVRRPPLWPIVLSLPLKLWSANDSLSVMYATEVLYHGWERFLYQLTVLWVPLVCSAVAKPRVRMP